jgi:hypothetical protein
MVFVCLRLENRGRQMTARPTRNLQRRSLAQHWHGRLRRGRSREQRMRVVKTSSIARLHDEPPAVRACVLLDLARVRAARALILRLLLRPFG